jgi:dTDP-glucose 4,6-dehydratase
MRIFVTGSHGFVGFHLVGWFLEHTDWEIVGLDSFRHAGDSLRDNANPRYRVFCHDLNAPIRGRLSEAIGPIDYILNLASMSCVDTSIKDPIFFWENNTRLIGNILEFARQKHVKKFLHCSTDEVFGPSAGDKPHKEWDPIVPSNPYSASKAAQEALCIAYWRTFGLPLIITNCMNMLGERQEVTSYLPILIRRISKNEEVVIHGSRENSGKRAYLDAKNYADACLFLLEILEPVRYGNTGEPQFPLRFNISGQEEVSNFELARHVAEAMHQDLRYRFEDFNKTRPGHDGRYAIDGSKIAILGWRQPIPLTQTIRRTIAWSREHPEWLRLESEFDTKNLNL